MRRRALAVVAGALAAVVLLAAPAAADPPRPTDYRSRVDRVEPPVEGLRVSIVGGDAFVELHADAIDVVVLGYQGEPYLHFARDGAVYENERSPSVALNRTRYGSGADTAADAGADPRWERVSGGGSYAWHDHRTHWMSPQAPLGRHPGDTILEGVVPLVVDGRPVEVHVRALWMPSPSPLPVVLGAVAAIAVVARTAARGRRPAAAVLGVAALAALAVGAWQTASLPAVTGPPRLHWMLPAVALAAAGAAAVLRRRRAPDRVVGALLLAAAVELLLWAWLRRDGLRRAVLPTDAPWWLDRAVTTAAGAVALGLTVTLLLDGIRGRRAA